MVLLLFFLCTRTKNSGLFHMIWTIFLSYLLILAAVYSEKNCNEILPGNWMMHRQLQWFFLQVKVFLQLSFVQVNITIALTTAKRIQRNERKPCRRVKWTWRINLRNLLFVTRKDHRHALPQKNARLQSILLSYCLEILHNHFENRQ